MPPVSQIHSLQINNLSLFDSNNLPINIHTASAIELNKIHYITIHLTQSKTDPFRTGADISIGNPTPIKILIDYLIVHPNKKDPKSNLLIHKDLTSLTRIQLMESVKKYLILINIQNIDQYTGHSFRKGGAQTLKDNGIDNETIQRAGRWKSSAHLLYHSEPLQFKLATNLKM
jgi:hypothetical protein